MLIEHETQKLKELDEEHSQELKEWREKLRPRKKVLHKQIFQRCSTKYHFISGKITLWCNWDISVMSMWYFSCVLQALEEEFTRKMQEQEVFFKMSGESECLNPTAQSRVSKFYPIPSVHSSGS